MTSAAPIEADPQTRDRTVDRVLSWLLYVVLLIGVAGLALATLMSVMSTDSCGTSGEDLSICNGNYLATLMIGFWGLQIACAVAVPILIIRATVKKRRSWHYPVLAGLLLVVAFAAYAFLLFR